MRYAQMMAAAMVVLAGSAAAQQPGSEPPAPDQSMEPEVVITPKEQGRVKEYRINGQLYMIEIVPTKGVPYYLVDTDGDGLLESRQNQLESGLLVPSWPILRW